MTDQIDKIDPDDYLQALADARAERDAIHPHRPVLDQPEPTADRPTSSTGRWLTDAERERGHARVAELRAQLERNRTDRKDPTG